jgi:acyl-CoA ligase (AMP-forming) (exosortase A-associated)
MSRLLHELLLRSPAASDAEALVYKGNSWSYGELAEQAARFAGILRRTQLSRGERVAVYLEKRFEAVAAIFGTAIAGGVFVPVNPLLKAEQVAYILRDCNVRVLVTSNERFAALAESLPACSELRAVVTTAPLDNPPHSGVDALTWAELRTEAPSLAGHRCIDSDMAAILYTSGSTGKPKGVVLSHRNVVTGAESVAQYLENTAEDRILGVLPLSFDYGLSQLTTAFHSGCCAVLMNYLLARDVVNDVARYRISGLAAVPPLWIQLAQLEWPTSVAEHLRYITNSGGKMPVATLNALRARLPKTRVFLMYGLTEAFRSTYLPPEELDRRPESMGKAIPNAEVVVVRPDGSPCGPNEEGELVHRGPLVSLGYWNDRERTAERFRPAPNQPPGIAITELAVWSGDTVRRDEDGFLYFVARKDDMIKSSGYRISPTEIEEVVYATGLVGEAAAIGAPHPVLGQAVVLVVTAPVGAEISGETVLEECKRRLPAYMVPARIEVRAGLERNANGKIDRKLLAVELQSIFGDAK